MNFEYIALPFSFMDTMDLETFDFPPLRTLRYYERGGDNDQQLYVNIYYTATNAPRYQFSIRDIPTNSSILAKIQAEIDEFNEDPTGNWTQLLRETVQMRMESVEHHIVTFTQERNRLAEFHDTLLPQS